MPDAPQPAGISVLSNRLGRGRDSESTPFAPQHENAGHFGGESINVNAASELAAAGRRPGGPGPGHWGQTRTGIELEAASVS